jgi:lysophospholipase L1-like esterase
MRINLPRKKRWLIIIVILAIIATVYLNRVYSHIYQVIGAADLKPVAGGEAYVINNMITENSLVYAALGDSLTAGAGADKPEEYLPYLLAQNFGGPDKKIILKNYSVPGAKTEDLVVSFLPLAIKDNPEIVTVLIGINDIHDFVSPTDFRNNYETILSRLTAETKAKVYVINIPFIGADELIGQPYRFYFKQKINKYNEIIKELAAKYSAGYVDLYTPTFSLLRQSGDHYSIDLFHPSASGYKIWADIIYADINK